MDDSTKTRQGGKQRETYTKIDESNFVDDEYKKGGKIHQNLHPHRLLSLPEQT